jgi:hypothetical protein
MANLKYIGNGDALLDVPARDINEAELAKLVHIVPADLLRSGLYTAIDNLPSSPPEQQIADTHEQGTPETENQQTINSGGQE